MYARVASACDLTLLLHPSASSCAVGFLIKALTSVYRCQLGGDLTSWSVSRVLFHNFRLGSADHGPLRRSLTDLATPCVQHAPRARGGIEPGAALTDEPD